MSSRTEVLEEGPHGISSVESPQTELDMLENLNLKVKVTVMMAICHSFHLNLCCAGDSPTRVNERSAAAVSILTTGTVVAAPMTLSGRAAETGEEGMFSL